MFKNKKAIGLEWYMLIVAIFMGVIWFYIAMQNAKTIPNYVGEHQFSILKTANSAENALFYIDQSAKFSLEQTIYNLVSNGGVFEIEANNDDKLVHPCGTYNGAYVWFQIAKDADKTLVTDCINEDVLEANLEYEFNTKLNEHILEYPSNILLDNYKYTINDGIEITGMAANPITFNIGNEKIKTTTITAKSSEVNPIISSDKDLVEFSKTVTAKTPQGDVDMSGICPRGVSCVLTKDAYDMLVKAQKRAKDHGTSLQITSAYRSIENQIAIWSGDTTSHYAQRYPDENERRKWVCYPYGSDVGQRCPHLTGNAVDIRLNGRAMTTSDWKLLEKIMLEAGWVRYANEPWHFECCNTQRYARAQELGVQVLV